MIIRVAISPARIINNIRQPHITTDYLTIVSHEETWSIRKPAIVSKGGIVTAQHHLTAEKGADVLRQGGNAVDAAIATAFALGVVEPWNRSASLTVRRMHWCFFPELSPRSSDR